MGKNKSYRIRTAVGNEAPSSVNVNLDQTFDTVDVLSLEIRQENFYKMPASGYGVIVGRVLANGGFGIPNAKVSVFVPYNGGSLFADERFLYHYTSPQSRGDDGIRYNLFPKFLDKACHQDIGSMYGKEYMLDNKDLIQVFDKYYKYTAVTNEAGDYFIYGVPVGNQTVHVDLDLSDIGVLSQRPRDLMYKGYTADMFDSPNVFKKDKNLNNLSQVFTQDNVVNVYPFWGDTSENPTNGVITRCDINIDYTFEPTCVFMGSIISDTGNKAISQRCVPDDKIGKMSELVTGDGKIEMIRKTFDGKVEQFSIKSNELIDNDGVWCYQIPMNLDYVMTDEFGKMVPTDDPNKGIATRARVRFRITMNDTPADETARKRARFLVPNNPKLNDDYPEFSRTHEADYEFGTFTKEESYRDLFWNKVYTVKSYVPRLQKAKSLSRRVHTGIKNVSHSGNNNPFPFNNLSIRLTFVYRFLCQLMTLFCITIYSLNTALGSIGVTFYYLGSFFAALGGVIDDFPKWLKRLFGIMTLGVSTGIECILDITAYILLKSSENIIIKLSNFCDDGNFDNPTYIPIGDPLLLSWRGLMESFANGEREPITVSGDCVPGEGHTYTFPSNSSEQYNYDLSRLFNCIENQLAQDQECTSFDFGNDWINGALYAPLWYRKVRSKKRILFGLVPIRGTDKWCDGTSSRFARGLSLCQTCAQKKNITSNTIAPLNKSHINVSFFMKPSPINEDTCYGYKCHKKAVSFINMEKGLIMPVETMLGDTVFYYKSVEFDKTNLYSQHSSNGSFGDIKMLFATDIVLIGSLNECDVDGVPQFFKYLESTTYNMPPDLLLMDYDSDETEVTFEPRAENAFLDVMNLLGLGDMGLPDLSENISESGSIDITKVYTDKTGADWGNYGRDQVREALVNNRDYLYTTSGESPDVGGLFYGLTCWSAYTKPKSCVNLSRICEYGVSLDETQENPVYNETENEGFKYKNMAPDGFISYDEIYDKDGRSMFATMNGNNLKTKTNPSNGFPVYDFMYLYQENFDGTLKNLMNPSISGADTPIPEPQYNNYKAEANSDAYIRFRYGRNREDADIQYYNSNRRTVGLYGNSIYSENKGRFPKYENSFYFYFGLKPGSTAIDKFRTLFYSDCKEDMTAQPIINVEFEGSDWCEEVTGNGGFIPGNGWFKLDGTNIDTPYNVYFADMSGNPENDVWCNGITEGKVYFSYSGEIESLNNEGYTLKDMFHIQDGEEQPYGLMNSRYRLTITDANGEEYKQYIDYTQPRINAIFDSKPFRAKNEDLQSEFGADFYDGVATLGGKLGSSSPEDMGDRNRIGGFIKVSDISQNGSENIDFSIEIEPLFDIATMNEKSVIPGTEDRARNYNPERNRSSYQGSYMELHQPPAITPPYLPSVYDNTLIGQLFENEPPYCPYGYDYPQYPESSPSGPYQTNGGKYDFRFGVPLGGKAYKVTVTMLCEKSNGNYFQTRNAVSTSITVNEPIEFKMLLNGNDYDIISKFKTGWIFNNQQFPQNYVHGNIGSIVGWDDMDNLDGLHIKEYIPEGEETLQQWGYVDYIQSDEDKLVTSESSSSPYKWSDEYVFDPETVLAEIGRYTTVPSTRQSGCAFIMVLRGNEYVYYKWNDNNDRYEVYLYNGQPVTHLSTQEYYDESDIVTKNNYIAALNNVISLRLNFVENLKSSLCMVSADTPFSIEVGYQTREVPVKTLLYHSPDEDAGTTTDFIPLDGNMEENVCYGITTPTLTGRLIDSNNNFIWNSSVLSTLGGISFQEIGNGEFKKPYLVAIQNAVKETLPVDIRNIPGGDGIESDIQTVSTMMFGIHLKDKRLRFVYNLWSPMKNWPMHDENDTSKSDDGEFISLPGLFAGFVLDGRPEYGEPVGGSDVYPSTFFRTQNVEGRPFDMVTFSIDSATREVVEDRCPVVRFIYSQDYDNTVYSDYKFKDVDFENALTGEFDDIVGNDGSKIHLLLYENYDRVYLSDDNSDVVVSGYGVVAPPQIIYPPETNGNSGYNLIATFEEGWYYTFYDGRSNPVYTKGNNNQCMVFNGGYFNPVTGQDNNGGMYFGDMDYKFNSNTEHFGSASTEDFEVWVDNERVFKKSVAEDTNLLAIPISTMYAVRISKDGQRRAVSKTFDVTRLEYMISYDTISQGDTLLTDVNFYVHINIGLRKHSNTAQIEEGFYYLRNFDFTIDFETEEDENLATVFVPGGYKNAANNIPVVNEARTKYIKVLLKHFETGDLVEAVEDFRDKLLDPISRGYVTDITGLSREMYEVTGNNGFKHSYYFDNE